MLISFAMNLGLKLLLDLFELLDYVLKILVDAIPKLVKSADVLLGFGDELTWHCLSQLCDSLISGQLFI